MTNCPYRYRALPNNQDFRSFSLSSLEIPTISYAEQKQRYGSYWAYDAHLRGVLLRLFGEPVESSSDIDEAYSYYIEASDASGQTWKLAVYSTSSGFIIGGNVMDASNRPAAVALYDLLLTEVPVDFEVMFDASDSGRRVTYGCRAGRCYGYEQ
jgi:hypothetical protein